MVLIFTVNRQCNSMTLMYGSHTSLFYSTFVFYPQPSLCPLPTYKGLLHDALCKSSVTFLRPNTHIYIYVTYVYMHIYSLHKSVYRPHIIGVMAKNENSEWKKGEKEQRSMVQHMLAFPFPISSLSAIHRDPWFICGLGTTRLPELVNFRDPTSSPCSSDLTNKVVERPEGHVTHC